MVFAQFCPIADVIHYQINPDVLVARRQYQALCSQLQQCKPNSIRYPTGIPSRRLTPRSMGALAAWLSPNRPEAYPKWHLYTKAREEKRNINKASNPYIHNPHNHIIHVTTSPHTPPTQGSHGPLSIIRKDLVRHDHDPQQEYRADEPEGEHGLPALADAALLQPGEGLEGLARGVAVEDGGVAVGRDAARGTPELDARDDEADQPQHEEHEAADHDDGGEEAPLEDEP